MKACGNSLVFSSGRTITTFRSVVGLSLNPALLKHRVFSGYDDYICTAADHSVEDPHALTKAEAIELAAFMVQAWKEYLDALL